VWLPGLFWTVRVTIHLNHVDGAFVKIDNDAEEFFPASLAEFEDAFHTEEACREYLLRVRWGTGFFCPACRGTKVWVNNRNLIVCSRCGLQTSLTSGTVMHGTKKPLQTWFKAIWWICSQKAGGSARDLQRLLGVGSYQTAWAWFQKLRRAMILADSEPCAGTVEIGHAVIGGTEAKVAHRAMTEKARVVGAIEVVRPPASLAGRLRMRHVADFSSRSLVPFVLENVFAGSRIITVRWEGYAPLGGLGYVHEMPGEDGLRAGGSRVALSHVNMQIMRLRQWLLSTHGGAVTGKHLQHYLDEFVFRHNWGDGRSPSKIFHRMLQGTTKRTAVPYWKLVGRTSPGQPLHSTGIAKK